MYNIITSFNQKYWEEIAKENVSLLDKNLPLIAEIKLYHELPAVDDIFSERVSWYDLYTYCPELPKFALKWKDNPKANGAGNKKNSFRWNAIKFVHKTFAIWHAAKMQESGWLIWLDCDATLFKTADESFLKLICPDKFSISFMGRPGKYSECGFIGFNLNRSETRDFLDEWEELYLSGKFIELPETHDSWTFDYIRKQKNSRLFFNVNSKAITNKNPFSQSLLGSHFAHAKGSQKEKQQYKILKRVK